MPRLRPSTWSIVLLVGAVTRANAAASFARPDARVFPDVFVWADTANVYVLRDGVEAASNAFQDNVSKPTPIEDLAQVSPHVFKFKRASFWPNFTLIVSDSGRALLVDCGLLDPEFLDETLEGMKKLYGLQAIDAVVVTHMHGDHFLQAPHVRDKWGARIWALDNTVEKMEHPQRFDYPAPIQAYVSGVDGVQVDRAFRPGESFDWEGYGFTIDWMPGQTEFALCMHGVIDGKRYGQRFDFIVGIEPPSADGVTSKNRH